LQSFATDWKQAKQEKDAALRRKLVSQRSTFIREGSPSPELVIVLEDIFSSYSNETESTIPTLNLVEASRLWYQSGMKLSALDKILKKKKDPSKVNFKDFLDLLKEVIHEDESFVDQRTYTRGSTVFKVRKHHNPDRCKPFSILTSKFSSFFATGW
jgi:hypothetical protein